MRVGHAGVALAAKRATPRVPLWLLLGAAYGPDGVEMVGRAFGHYNTEISHSLVSVAICATIVAGVYAGWTRDLSGAAIVWLTYALHWPADFVTGHKPTWPGGPEVGLDLYKHTKLVWVVDLMTFGCGWLIYRERPTIAPATERSSRS
jgi:hypothetical protein